MKRTIKEIFSDYISGKGLISTRQRGIILDAFLSPDRHMSVDELYRKVWTKHPKIGYVTVYRTLKLFVESGIAREIQFGDGVTRYDCVTEGEHHDHMVCNSCGAITEFQNDNIEKLQGEVAASHGYLIESHKLELYGLCALCRDDGHGE